MYDEMKPLHTAATASGDYEVFWPKSEVEQQSCAASLMY